MLLKQLLFFIVFLLITPRVTVSQENTPSFQALAALEKVHNELIEQEVFGFAAESNIDQVVKTFEKSAQKSASVQLAVCVVKIDRGLDVSRELAGLASRNKTSWTAWRVKVVSALVFDGANSATTVLSVYQKNVLGLIEDANSSETVRKEGIAQLAWIKSTAEEVGTLASASEKNISRIIDNPKATEHLRSIEGRVASAESELAQRLKNQEAALKAAATDAEKTTIIAAELTAIESRVQTEIDAAAVDFTKKLSELEPLAAEVVAAQREASTAARSLSSARRDLDRIDEDEDGGETAKATARVLVREMESRLANANADVIRAQGPFRQKLGEMEQIYLVAADTLNSAKNRILLIKRDYKSLFAANPDIAIQCTGVENTLGQLLARFPPMPTFVKRKSSKETELEDTRALVSRLQVSVAETFAELRMQVSRE